MFVMGEPIFHLETDSNIQYMREEYPFLEKTGMATDYALDYFNDLLYVNSGLQKVFDYKHDIGLAQIVSNVPLRELRKLFPQSQIAVEKINFKNKSYEIPTFSFGLYPQDKVKKQALCSALREKFDEIVMQEEKLNELPRYTLHKSALQRDRIFTTFGGLKVNDKKSTFAIEQFHRDAYICKPIKAYILDIDNDEVVISSKKIIAGDYTENINYVKNDKLLEEIMQ